MEPRSVSALKKGETSRISGFKGDDFPIKFYDLGLLPGTEITLIHKTGRKGVFTVSVLPTHLQVALRYAEASILLIE